ncbi:MAG: hypothetical protein WCP45_14625, partial [Verrucomicrobiota bacterium]
NLRNLNLFVKFIYLRRLSNTRNGKMRAQNAVAAITGRRVQRHEVRGEIGDHRWSPRAKT